MQKDVLLSIKDLNKSFGELKAVDGLSLDIYKNEIIGLLGPNGAGKTTTIKMICGLLKSDSGKIDVVDGANNNLKNDFLRYIGVCPQEIVVWKFLTCEEQLILMCKMYNIPHKEAKKRSHELLEKLGLYEKRKKLAKTLSGGMKRRLNIALAVIHKPEIVVFDEPEAGLDPQSRVLVRDYIKSLKGDMTVLVTTHNMDEADRVCDRVAIIDHGKLLLVDEPKVLKARSDAGNIVEVVISPDKVEEIKNAINTKLAKNVKKIDHIHDRLIIHIKDITENLSEVLNILNDSDIRQDDINFRWTTLEDVFISLTGRSLRE